MLIIPINQCQESKHGFLQKNKVYRGPKTAQNRRRYRQFLKENFGRHLREGWYYFQKKSLFRQLSYRKSYLRKTSEGEQKKRPALCQRVSPIKILDFLINTKTVVTQRNHCCKGIYKIDTQKRRYGGVLAQKRTPSMPNIGPKKIT